MHRFFFFLPLFLFAQPSIAQHNREIFRAEGSAWAKTHYFAFAFERSLGPTSITMSIGGGKLGHDNQYLSPGQLSSVDERERVNESQTIDTDFKIVAKGCYLERCESWYSGPVGRISIAHYFMKRPRHSDRLKGLYVNLDLITQYTIEKQTLTFKSKTAEKRYVQNGENRFITLGMGVGVGYQWYPAGQHLAVNMNIAHPFYLPLTEEINTSSPFAGGRWEARVGIGWRIGTY